MEILTPNYFIEPYENIHCEEGLMNRSRLRDQIVGQSLSQLIEQGDGILGLQDGL